MQLHGLSSIYSTTDSLARQARAVAGRVKEEAENILDSRHAGTRYSFLPPDSCSEDCDSDHEDEKDDWTTNKIYKQLPSEIYRDLRRPSQFQRLESDTANKTNHHSFIMKDLVAMNLSIFSPTTSYSMFDNQSTDSLDSHTDSPAGFKLPKSHSSHLLTLPNREHSIPSCTELSELSNPSNYQTKDSPVQPSIKKSDSQFTFQSYSCSSRNSTLSSCYRELSDTGHLVDLTEEGHETEDEASTISGYDSLEAVNMPDTKLSLSNPHYSGPHISQEEKHSSYAEALKCPTDESDTVQCEGVEMREKSGRHAMVRPRSEVISTNCNRARPLSAGKVDGVRGEMGQLVMYVVGGREVGKVTVFNRNISIWKLQL